MDRLQVIIGNLLRIGVYASISIAALGGIIFLLHHGNQQAAYTAFKGIPDYAQPAHVFGNILHLKGGAIIQAGIMLLIATPVFRLIFSAVGFVIEKDHLYTFITLLVLGIITFSMLSGYAG
ncbi:DUF1634 domain-containing protein [Mucilaginibacter limnophilus]|uniref:DUF1634 domain-containing protein n=1 Tax=Mucilaginibacter limnophilus TaxID=1932778 RepID=A0A3S2UNF6_9SPHI|nr:DUF1634 domain-containing protein [Mucilaginibacter limnophilus]RVU02031.1 DUF1634 domain-containing protein [Mucilaginibacter limnophilus]